MNKDIQYAIKNICKGHVSDRFSFYPGSFPEDYFADDFRLIESRDDFTFVETHLRGIAMQTTEIGVDGGNYSRKIINALSPVLHYCIDPYKKYDHPHSHSWPQEEIDKLYSNLVNNIFEKEIKNGSVKILKKISSEGIKEIPDDCIDFMYIDGNHWFEYVSDDLFNSLRVIKKDGIIAGHDFYGDVPAAVYLFCKKTDFKLRALSLDKLNDNELCPSFYLTRLNRHSSHPLKQVGFLAGII